MPRICFVIMPFSSTESCTGDQWTWIFENLLKPAVEDAGLGYDCKRSVATRGNLVAAILRDLRDAYVVLADLTDRNANVFYELGVRHSLVNRTILIAQKGEDIPFDLRAYAYHVYNWKTDEGRADFREKIAKLLSDVDTDPKRADNPVSDFLGHPLEHDRSGELPVVAATEVVTAQPLAGQGADGLVAASFALQLIKGNTSTVIPQILRLTRAEVQPVLKDALNVLNQKEAPQQVTENQIASISEEYIKVVEPHPKS